MSLIKALSNLALFIIIFFILFYLLPPTIIILYHYFILIMFFVVDIKHGKAWYSLTFFFHFYQFLFAGNSCTLGIARCKNPELKMAYRGRCGDRRDM